MQKSAIVLSAIRAVIFDFSGLILADRELTWLVVNDVLEKFGKARITLAQFQDEFELPFYKIFGKHGIDENLAASVALEVYHQNYHKYEHLVKLVDDAKFCIEFLLANGIKVGIVSQTPRKELDCQLDKNGLGFLKCYTIAQKEAPEEKPSPIPLLLCMHKLGATREKTLYVGDMFQDVECGRSAGVMNVVVDNPSVSYHTRTKLRDAKPDYLVGNLRELVALFEEGLAVIA